MKNVSNEGPQKSFYRDERGLKPVRRSERNLLPEASFSEYDMDILLLSDSAQTSQVEAHFVVEDVISALPSYIQQGYTIAVEPFDTVMGKCAVIQDMLGTRICIFDKTNTFVMADRLGADWPAELS